MDVTIRQLERLVGPPMLQPNIVDDYLQCDQDYSEPLSPVTILKTAPVAWKDTCAQKQHEQGIKRRPCIFLCLHGVCKHGKHCQYSHDPEQCSHFHEIWHEYIEALKAKGIYGRRPCQQFLAGYCHKGDYCTFRH